MKCASCGEYEQFLILKQETMDRVTIYHTDKHGKPQGICVSCKEKIDKEIK